VSPRARPDARRDLARGLAEKRILVVGGAGGVGKTTTAAALALQAALQGRRVLVCTIDPARRLATSLGLEKLTGTPRRLDLHRLAPDASGQMWAMMLDTKRTFDALVLRHTHDEEARDRILENRFYRHVSTALAGSHEYMAMEKLLDLDDDERFDLVILDTPPTRHALDFLEAPDRLMGFLDTSVLKWVLKPYFVAGRLTLKVATRTGALALSLADRFLGLQFLQDLSEFFLAFEGMYDGFKERAGRVRERLRQDSTGFVVVTSPARLALEQAAYFHRRLEESELPFVAFVANRVHVEPSAGNDRRAARIDADLAEALATVHGDQVRLARHDQRALTRLEADTGEPVLAVPELEADVHDLRGLLEVADAMLGSAPLPAVRRRRRVTAGAASSRNR
jgi:anion-transporting  ArsA/GET3 family ATPase